MYLRKAGQMVGTWFIPSFISLSGDALIILPFLARRKLPAGSRAIPSIFRRILVNLRFNHGTRVVFPAPNVPEYRREEQNSSQESDGIVHCVRADGFDCRQDENNRSEQSPHDGVSIHPPA